MHIDLDKIKKLPDQEAKKAIDEAKKHPGEKGVEKAKEAGDLLCVIVNNDIQRGLKGSKFFQDQDERIQIIRALSIVDMAWISVDKDLTQNETLKVMVDKFYGSMKLAFANGGDQTNETIPEADICRTFDIELIDGLGDKIQSSSWLLGNK